MNKLILSLEGNPLYNIWDQNKDKKYTDPAKIDIWDIRGKYAYAIPDEEAIKAIVKLSPIIEIGAGRGYWAKLIHDAGGEIIAYDKYPPSKKNTKNWYFKDVGLFYNVKWGGIEKLDKYPNHTLFLCWPPYKISMASTCLNRYKGKYVIYVGESEQGCTGDNKFHDVLINQFKKIEIINIPKFNCLHDRMWIYERK